MKFINFLFALAMAGMVGGLLALIFNDFTFTGNATQEAGFLANATAEAESMGFYGDFQFAVWKFWPIGIGLAIIIAGIIGLGRKKNNDNQNQ